MTETHPQSFATGPGRAGISSAQAAALLSGRLGWTIGVRELERAAYALEKEGRLEKAGRLWSFVPEDVLVLEGELWLRKATWRLKRARLGQFLAWVEDARGTWRVLPLPYAMDQHQALNGVDGEPPRSLACFEWPTGEWTASLVRGEDRDNTPAYAYVKRPEGE